jgi:hypothetical protein
MRVNINVLAFFLGLILWIYIGFEIMSPQSKSFPLFSRYRILAIFPFSPGPATDLTTASPAEAIDDADIFDIKAKLFYGTTAVLVVLTFRSMASRYSDSSHCG